MTSDQPRRGPQQAPCSSAHRAPAHMIVLQPDDQFVTRDRDNRPTVWLIDHDGAPTALATTTTTTKDPDPWTR